ncbi:biopolymer transporter ExbD [uncultured Limimaricola sp.]|uniref:ExbD/TolR family protein n=1 Tax=uncultured Limimaricola sp. TaxID=2211667 RepID=UPI0030F8352B
MTFDEPPRRPQAESIVPMINVVFLLLIFFLMTAQIAPPEPFEVTPPEAEAEMQATAELVLHLSSKGELAFRNTVGEGAVAAASAEAGNCDECDMPPLTLRADAGVPAVRLAALLPELSAAGFSAIELMTAAP